jgi:cell division protein FtsB
MQQVVDNARLMSDISAALAKVSFRGRRGMPVSESPIQASRDSLLWMVKDVATRVTASESRLAASQRRIKDLTTLSDSMKAVLDTAVTNLHNMIENQKSTITTLGEQINDLKSQNAELIEAKAAVTDTLQTMTQKDNTVYYVIGTKDELIRRGLITEEGGSHFLFVFGKRGTTLTPARDLNLSEFTAVDMRQTTEIPLPNPQHSYRIASGQNVAFLTDTSVVHEGVLQAPAIKIGSPSQFWMPSKFLIVVDEG